MQNRYTILKQDSFEITEIIVEETRKLHRKQHFAILFRNTGTALTKGLALIWPSSFNGL